MKSRNLFRHVRSPGFGPTPGKSGVPHGTSPPPNPTLYPLAGYMAQAAAGLPGCGTVGAVGHG
jgi:hypothetical protein